MPLEHFVDILRTATVDALRDSVRRQMPSGPLQEYFRFGLQPGRPEHDQFIQATGVNQLIKLYGTLVDGLVDQAIFDKVADLLARIAVYQTYEIISDNLGIGLFGSTRDAPTTVERARLAGQRRLIRSFNAAMTARLRGGSRRAAVVLAPHRGQAGELSALEQSLATRTHRELTASLADPSLTSGVEADVWPALVANIEAAGEVTATVAGTPFAAAVRDGLTERYWAIGRTLSGRHLSRLELATVGAHSVLVVPTLAYCLAVIADLTHPVPGLAATLDDGSLVETLYDAAVLSRLLNDAGTGLLRLSPPARRAALRRARVEAAGAGLAASLTGPRFTRLAKDLTHREFNICLYAARRAADPVAAFTALESDLEYFGGLYALHTTRLTEALDRLTTRVGDPRPAALVGRFVRFHVELYANPYQEASGEYAI